MDDSEKRVETDREAGEVLVLDAADAPDPGAKRMERVSVPPGPVRSG